MCHFAIHKAAQHTQGREKPKTKQHKTMSTMCNFSVDLVDPCSEVTSNMIMTRVCFEIPSLNRNRPKNIKKQKVLALAFSYQQEFWVTQGVKTSLRQSNYLCSGYPSLQSVWTRRQAILKCVCVAEVWLIHVSPQKYNLWHELLFVTAPCATWIMEIFAIVEWMLRTKANGGRTVEYPESPNLGHSKRVYSRAFGSSWIRMVRSHFEEHTQTKLHRGLAERSCRREAKEKIKRLHA